jgi:hypothetical protein
MCHCFPPFSVDVHNTDTFPLSPGALEQAVGV